MAVNEGVVIRHETREPLNVLSVDILVELKSCKLGISSIHLIPPEAGSSTSSG
jgi:hypothetical protein